MRVNLGGPPGVLWISPRSPLFEGAGMTAIGLVGSPIGFVMGADGRMRITDESRGGADQASLDSETDAAQKIFEIRDQDKTLAYAVSGFVKLDGFHLLDEIQKKIEWLSRREFDTCKKYLSALCSRLNDDINEARKNKTIETLPALYRTESGTAWKILDLFTVGYFRGAPSLIVSQFYHSDGVQVDFDVNSYPSNYAILSGSEPVRAAMYPNLTDARFSAYRKQLAEPVSLQDAAEYVSGYIAACSSDLAREIDYAKWKITGGDTHIAQVTPSEGFEWLVPPKKLGT